MLERDPSLPGAAEKGLRAGRGVYNRYQVALQSFVLYLGTAEARRVIAKRQ